MSGHSAIAAEPHSVTSNTRETAYFILSYGNFISPKDRTVVSSLTVFEELTGRSLVLIQALETLTAERLHSFLSQGARIYRLCAGLVAQTSVYQRERDILQKLSLPLFRSMLTIADLRLFRPAVSLKDHLNEVTFVTNKRFWGSAVRITPRRIDLGDYLTIIRLATAQSTPTPNQRASETS